MLRVENLRAEWAAGSCFCMCASPAMLKWATKFVSTEAFRVWDEFPTNSGKN